MEGIPELRWYTCISEREKQDGVTVLYCNSVTRDTVSLVLLYGQFSPCFTQCDNSLAVKSAHFLEFYTYFMCFPGASLAQDRGRLEARIEALNAEVISLKKQSERENDALKIKTKMIDDQTDTIRKLKEVRHDPLPCPALPCPALPCPVLSRPVPSLPALPSLLSPALPSSVLPSLPGVLSSKSLYGDVLQSGVSESAISLLLLVYQ